jgi:hypothetical protein
MDILVNLAINFVVAFISFAVGWLWQRAREVLRTRPARTFWRLFLTSQTQIIVARFFGPIGPSKFRHEQIGVIGCGTAAGVTELRVFLQTLCSKSLPLSYADTIEGDSLKTHLILLGGPRSSSLMKETLDRIPTTWRFEKKPTGENILVDKKTGDIIEALIRDDPSSPGREEVGTDYAVIISTNNPFAQEKRLLQVAGIHDYGTWAAMRFVLSQEFLRHPLVRKGKAVEALIEVDVLKGAPQHIGLIAFRELSLP